MSGRKSLFAIGDQVTWRHETRGGYGHITHVPAYVVKLGAKRIGIATMWIDGETWVPRWVAPESLRPGHPSLLGVPS